MKFGLNMPNWAGSPDPSGLAELAVAAEAAGWDGFFIWDHTFHQFPVLDPWVILTAVAVQTERINIGTMVTPVPRRRPIKLAREMATLDNLSKGRLILGVGIGDLPWEWAYCGEEPSLKVRGEMLDEALEILTACWQGQALRHQGKYYRAQTDVSEEFELLFTPGAYQNRQIPVWVGGVWPNKRPFIRASQWQGVYPIKLEDYLTPEDSKNILDTVMKYRELEEPFDLVISGWSNGDKPDEARARVLPYQEMGATWWVESLDPWRFGWEHSGQEWPLEQVRERIEQGPPIPKSITASVMSQSF
jgi:hypothetical protein